MKINSAKFVKGIIGSDDILTDGLPQVAFVGRSNVGKSSVINSLAGVDGLVKTGKKPGKTTEINFFLINRQFYFVDLPGYSYAKLSPTEREKARKRMLWYLTESEARPLVVLILDIKAGLTEFDGQMLELVEEEKLECIVVVNKVDKVNQKEISRQVASIKENPAVKEVIPCSAFTKQGIEPVLEVIANSLDIER